MTNTANAWRSNPSRARPVVTTRPTNGTPAKRPANGAGPAPDTPTTPTTEHDLVQSRHQHDRTTRGVHIRRVPTNIWRRARTNALLSEVPFREYVIGLLAECEPRAPTT